MRIPDFAPDPELYPFESCRLASSAGSLHYVDEGAGRPILMLHGNPTWSFLYRHLIRELRDEFRCVAVDYLGFGLSERPDGFGYTPAEHAMVIGELIEELDLRDLIVMGHDWGGPIGLSTAADHAERVTGIVLGSTWFWPLDPVSRIFGRVLSTRPMRRQVVVKNLFVERLLFSNVRRDLSEKEKEHYRGVQPTPEMRVGVAEFPHLLVAATPWLADLEPRVRERLHDKRALTTYPMLDKALPAKRMLPRYRATFDDLEVVELRNAKHYFQEDEPAMAISAIRSRFGSSR